MDIKQTYNEWLENAVEDKDLTAELESIKNNEDEIYDRFYTALKFGTAGLRGIIGAGTNRMNIYVVRQATQGLANYVLKKYGNGSVAISHDSRIKADLFMMRRQEFLRQTALRFTSHQNFSLLPFSLTSFVTLNVRQVLWLQPATTLQHTTAIRHTVRTVAR